MSLLLPYVALLISGVLTYADGFRLFADTPVLPFLTAIPVFFSFSAVIWGPLYTWMVIVMLIWGRSRSIEEIRRLYILSPCLLAGSMGYPALLVDLRMSMLLLVGGFLQINNMGYVAARLFEGFERENMLVIGTAWFVMAAMCLGVGYIFVGIALWLERLMNQRGWLKEEFATSYAEQSI